MDEPSNDLLRPLADELSSGGRTTETGCAPQPLRFIPNLAATTGRAMMEAPASEDRVAVVAKTDSGRLCTVTVQRDPLGKHLLRYEGSETVVAILTPEAIELLTVALSLRGRSAVPARCSIGGACTLLVIGHRDGRTSLYFHASPATSAVLDATSAKKLQTALESLASGP